MPISRAYCFELDEIVTITQARRAYLSRNDRSRRFNFSCTNEICRRNGVVISGVNHTIHPEDSSRCITPHFRDIYEEKHVEDCEWRVINNIIDVQNKLENEDDHEFLQRQLRRKLSDFITDFDPRETEDHKASNGLATQQGGRLDYHQNFVDFDGNPNHGMLRVRTSDLERLVECYRDTFIHLSFEERCTMSFNIVGICRVPMFDYFRKISRCLSSPYPAVIFGDAYVAARDRSGFTLEFNEQVNQRPVRIVITHETMESYRFRNYLKSFIEPNNQRLLAYVLGTPTQDEEHEFRIGITDLRRLVLVRKWAWPVEPH